jgi:uncharacterized protein (TIGR02265 family)
VKRCLEAVGEQRFVEFFSYPVVAHLRLVRMGAELLAPRCGSMEEALRQLGRRAAGDFFKSPAGRATRLLAGDSPRLLMNAIPEAYRVALSTGERRVTWLGSAHGRLWLQRDFVPNAYQEGIVLGVLEVASAKAPWAQAREVGELETEVEFGWEAGRLR